MSASIENWLLFKPEVHLRNIIMRFIVHREHNYVCYENQLVKLEITHIFAYRCQILKYNYNIMVI